MAAFIHPLTTFRNHHRPHLSQVDFGEKVKVKGMTVYRWEAGISLPRAKQMPLLTKLTGIPAADFYAAYHAIQAKLSRPRKKAA